MKIKNLIGLLALGLPIWVCAAENDNFIEMDVKKYRQFSSDPHVQLRVYYEMHRLRWSQDYSKKANHETTVEMPDGSEKKVNFHVSEEAKRDAALYEAALKVAIEMEFGYVGMLRVKE